MKYLFANLRFRLKAWKIYNLRKAVVWMTIIVFLMLVPLAVWATYTYWPGSRAQELNSDPRLEGLVYAEITGFSEGRIHILLVNNSPYWLEFHGGRSPALEHRTLFAWREKPIGRIRYIDIGVFAEAHTSRQLSIRLENVYRHGLIPWRNYRARLEVSSIWSQDGSHLGHFGGHSVVVEFRRADLD